MFLLLLKGVIFMYQKLSDKEIEISLNKSIEKIPLEMKKIKFILFLMKLKNKQKLNKNDFFKIIFIIYTLLMTYCFFKK